MINYKADTIVERYEAEALKEIIFKRARERAMELDSDVKKSYTGSMQNDIMDLARNSFTSSNNPFSPAVSEDQKTVPESVNIKKDETVGFPQRKSAETKSDILYRAKVSAEKLTNQALAANMAEAHADFTKKESFMGALNFLNSQASVALIKSRGKSFEAVA